MQKKWKRKILFNNPVELDRVKIDRSTGECTSYSNMILYAGVIF
ncbi:hypothetical protein [Paenibacillus sp. RC67]|nr:hypothetical protein [Paenibacillus sp. RC67]